MIRDFEQMFPFLKPEYLLKDGVYYLKGSDFDIDKKYSLFIEKGEVFTQSIKLPGVSKEQIKVTVKENKFEVEVKEDTSFYLKGYKELYSLPKYGKFKETKALMKDGILTVTIPKKQVDFEVRVD